jgi:hypothetical protein
VKNLYHSLIDYEMGLLQGIASCRAVSLNTSNHAEAVELLAKALLSPAATAIALADLSPAEQEALQLILSQGGRLEVPRFAREYGYIRPMGSARLMREQPWRNPVNPAEGLWYKGLIFKTFQAVPEGSLEMVYIPADLLPLLEITAQTNDLRPPTIEALKVSLMPTPNVVISGEGRLRENIFSLLVHLQTNPVRLESSPRSSETVYSHLTAKDRNALASCLLSPLPSFTPEAELEFLLHLGLRASLLVVKHGRLRPDRDPTRTWLQAHHLQQVWLLQNTWRTDPTWNDLWHTPGLAPQPTGWENSPLLARSKIMGYLAQTLGATHFESAPHPDQMPSSAGDWLSLDDFVATIKRIEPDFQRPGGDYNTWYIYDRQGQPLMGFEYWNQVEGALILYLLTHILLLLDVVELGAASATSQPVSFRLTPLGQSFLQDQAPSLPADKKTLLLRVDSNFYAHVPARASLYDRFQLARFAELEQREPRQTIYHITQASINHAFKNGVAADQITTFLARATDNQTPLKVVESILTWGARQNTVRLEQATLLRVKQASLLVELRQHPALDRLLGEVINPTTVLIPSDKVAEVRRLLRELGYLE